MTRVICSPKNHLPNVTPNGVNYFSLYSNPGRPDIGTIAPGWKKDICRLGLNPSIQVWDFVSLALSIAAADLSCIRSNSVDGWTRVIDLDVHLYDTAPWLQQKKPLEEMLRYLTGDFWTVSFLPGGEPPPESTDAITYDADCVSLLSGGVDSIVGAIDLTDDGRRPLFVSQIAKGDKETQNKFALALDAKKRHFQWNHRIKPVRHTERSTRGRSIVFFAFAALASSVIAASIGRKVEIFVPENGFISLNVPLTTGRFGSFSTKTTHPVFLSRLQSIWDSVGINAELLSPYRYDTKGELLANCKDQALLLNLVGDSTSCGRYGHYGYTHCGRCVPCLVRRASFIRANLNDTTPRYYFNNLKNSGREKGANDINAVAIACLQADSIGVQRSFGGAISFSDMSSRQKYEGVIHRGLQELGVLLKQHGVI